MTLWTSHVHPCISLPGDVPITPRHLGASDPPSGQPASSSGANVIGDITPPSVPEGFDECYRLRASLFPSFPWGGFPDAATHSHFRPRPIEAVKLGKEWPFSAVLLAALHWYWGKVRWVTDTPQDGVSDDVTWIELMLDFQHATRVALFEVAEEDEEADIVAKAKLFQKVSAALAKVLHTNIGPTTSFKPTLRRRANSLAQLGFTPAAGIPCRPNFVCHDATAASILLLCIKPDRPMKREFGLNGKSLHCSLPHSTAPPVWDLPSRGPLLSSASVPPPPVVPGRPRARRQRHVRLADRCVNVRWTAEELQQVRDAHPRDRAPLRKAFVHNRVASTNHKHLISFSWGDDGRLTRFRCTHPGCSSSCHRLSFATWSRGPCPYSGAA